MKKTITEVHLMREKKNQTFRPISKGLENVLYSPFKVLDKGLLEL